jgi:hypothetical protein
LLLSLVGGTWSAFGGYAYWTSAQQRDAGTWLMLGGTGLLAVSAIFFCLWLWRFLHGSAPWGRLMLAVLLLNYLVGRPLVGVYPWSAPVDSVLSWGLLVGLVLRWRQLHSGQPAVVGRRDTATVVSDCPAHNDAAARWAAGAVGESIVANALARIENDHVVIHNLPLEKRGDVDHVVVGPAGAVVIETKYLAGRIVCASDGAWTQVKRGELREITDPAAQVQRAADGLANLLERRGFPEVPVYALLVMAHARAELDVARSAVLVVRPYELVPQLHQLAISRPQLDPARVTAAVAALLDCNRAPHAHSGAERLEE